MAYQNSTLEWKEFLRFLEEREVKAAYIHNTIAAARPPVGRTRSLLQELRTIAKMWHYVWYAFIWEDTTEGKVFWSKIDRAWQVRYRYLRNVGYFNQ